MEKVSSQNSITSSNIKINKLSDNYFSSINGVLSFYNLKPFSRIPILKNINITGYLKEDGKLAIYIIKDGADSEFYEVKESLQYNYGLGFTLFHNTLFFQGNFMDGFNFNHLSENISTYILNGNMASLSNTKRITSIGKLKRIEDILHLNSSLRISGMTKTFSYNKKRLKPNFLGIDITMQFKRRLA